MEDLYEILIGSVPGIKFGLAFSEASGDCLIRSVGNDPELESAAVKMRRILRPAIRSIYCCAQAFPINVLNAIKNCSEVCSIFCATANPVEVILAQSEQGRGVSWG